MICITLSPAHYTKRAVNVFGGNSVDLRTLFLGKTVFHLIVHWTTVFGGAGVLFNLLCVLLSSLMLFANIFIMTVWFMRPLHFIVVIVPRRAPERTTRQTSSRLSGTKASSSQFSTFCSRFERNSTRLTFYFFSLQPSLGLLPRLHLVLLLL